MYFPLVDMLRTFAALSVLVYHLIAHWDWSSFPESGPLAWFRSGWMAVDLFFVISGFVIGLSAFSRFEAQGRGFRAGFMRARLARIVPLYLLTLVAYIALVEPALVHKADFWPDVAAHLLFVHNWFFDWNGAINGPSWSLGTEMQFYLLMAFAAPWLARARPWRMALLLIVTAWAWRWGAYALFYPGPLDRPYMAQTQLPGMLDEFAAGLLLARFVRAPAGIAFITRMRSDARLRYAFAAAIGLCAWALSELFMGYDYWQVPAMAIFFRTALATCAVLVVALLCAWPMPRHRALIALPMYLGKVSYGIYLWHLPVLFFLGAHTQLQPAVALMVALAATVALASLSWRFIERPLLARWASASDTLPHPSTRTEHPMDDRGVLEHIEKLVHEEHELLGAQLKTDDKAARLKHVGEQLDQCWDLLRQRRAKREFGENPDDAKPRDMGTVEGYIG